jgi:hypothetical protein
MEAAGDAERREQNEKKQPYACGGPRTPRLVYGARRGRLPYRNTLLAGMGRTHADHVTRR